MKGKTQSYPIMKIHLFSFCMFKCFWVCWMYQYDKLFQEQKVYKLGTQHSCYYIVWFIFLLLFFLKKYVVKMSSNVKTEVAERNKILRRSIFNIGKSRKHSIYLLLSIMIIISVFTFLLLDVWINKYSNIENIYLVFRLSFCKSF